MKIARVIANAVEGAGIDAVDYGSDQKFRAYRRIVTLRHSLLIAQDQIAQDQVRVEHFERLPGGVWALVGDHDDISASVEFRDLGGSVPLAAVYRRVLA